MKNLITSIFLLFSLAMFGQDWQLDGTKYPNATNEGDTVSLATKVPLWDADNLQNYFADLGDILALNPVPPTPTLQSVTEAGATTDQGIQITGQAGLSVIDGLKLYTAGSSSIIQNYISGAPRSTINFLPNTTQIAFHPSGGGTQTIFNIQEESISNPGVQLDSRLGIEYAINNNEAVTLGQVIDSIQANSIVQESGTFTPALIDENGGATYTSSIIHGSYIKTGKVVMCSINFDGISTSGTPNGALRITGLPYLYASGFGTGDIYRFINSGLTTLPTSVSINGNSLYFTEPTSVEVIEAPTFNSGTVTIRITYTTNE